MSRPARPARSHLRRRGLVVAGVALGERHLELAAHPTAERVEDVGAVEGDDGHAVGDLAPDVRAIIVLRDPVDRAWSQMRHARLHGLHGEGGASALPADLHARSDYAGTLARWRAGLGADRVHVVTVDRLLTDPARALDGIAAFLGLGAFTGDRGPAGPVVNGAPGPPCPPALLAQLRAELAPAYVAVRAEDPEVVDGWIARHYG